MDNDGYHAPYEQAGTVSLRRVSIDLPLIFPSLPTTAFWRSAFAYLANRDALWKLPTSCMLNDRKFREHATYADMPLVFCIRRLL